MLKMKERLEREERERNMLEEKDSRMVEDMSTPTL